jgi:glycosyltransferase involved in cell wall biosynthesis
MRLLVVGHPFLLAYNQKKYVAMKRLDPGLRLRLLVPSRGSDRFEVTDYQLHPALNAEEVIPLRTYLERSHMTYLHDPISVGKVLANFQPDVIHLEAEPQACISVETIALQRSFAKRAAVTLFTWDNLLRNRRFPVGTLKRQLRRYSLARSTTVICGNRRAAELLKAERLFKGQVEVLPQYGLDISDYQSGADSELRAQLGLEDQVVIGYFGRLVAEKGLRTLFEALCRLQMHPWKLLLVGTGPLEAEIRERWMTKFPDRIQLVPAVPYEQVPRYLGCLDIFVLASHSTATWKEQFGLSLAQAMLFGIASIGSTCGAIPEVLGPGGMLFEEGQPDGLRQALETLLTSATRRQQVGALGREFALRHFTSETVAARYLNIFETARRRLMPGKQFLAEATINRKM